MPFGAGCHSAAENVIAVTSVFCSIMPPSLKAEDVIVIAIFSSLLRNTILTKPHTKLIKQTKQNNFYS